MKLELIHALATFGPCSPGASAFANAANFNAFWYVTENPEHLTWLAVVTGRPARKEVGRALYEAVKRVSGYSATPEVVPLMKFVEQWLQVDEAQAAPDGWQRELDQLELAFSRTEAKETTEYGRYAKMAVRYLAGAVSGLEATEHHRRMHLPVMFDRERGHLSHGSSGYCMNYVVKAAVHYRTETQRDQSRCVRVNELASIVRAYVNANGVLMALESRIPPPAPAQTAPAPAPVGPDAAPAPA